MRSGSGERKKEYQEFPIFFFLMRKLLLEIFKFRNFLKRDSIVRANFAETGTFSCLWTNQGEDGT